MTTTQTTASGVGARTGPRNRVTVPEFPAAQPATASIRQQGVIRAIAEMQAKLGESQELDDVARAARMSPYHFHRVFQSVTSATPARFLTAMRMAEAKRLLIESDRKTAEVGLAVGYLSLGTFTSQFAKLVGMPPGRFRRLAAAVAEVPMGSLLSEALAAPPDGCMSGQLSRRPDRAESCAVVALFSSTIPQGIPKACAVVRSDGSFSISAAGCSPYAVRTVSIKTDATVREVLTESSAAGLCVGAAAEPADACDHLSIQLRRPRITDPPLILAFPLLLTSG